MPLRRSLVTACNRWFPTHSDANLTMASASTANGVYQSSKDASSRVAPSTNTNTNSAPKNPQTLTAKVNGNKDTLPRCHVNFGAEDSDAQDRKKKYLTAKYGQHQMNLIKKRLRVEMWMYEQLALLYDSNDSSELEIDLDELLDLENESNREKWLREKVIDAKRSPKEVDQFVIDLLERAKTL